MNRYRNKLVYNADTGEIRDDVSIWQCLRISGYQEEKVVEELKLLHFLVDKTWRTY